MTRKSNFIGDRKGVSVSIFIILAIFIVIAIILIVMFKDNLPRQYPREVQPVYDYFLSCVEEETTYAALIMGSQGGYIEMPEFEPGSDYMPFSSQLDFLGGVPYWYYVSRNGIPKEQIPSKQKMQEQLRLYLKNRIDECNFRNFEEQGFIIEKGDIDVKTQILEREIIVDVEMPLIISYEDSLGSKTNHKVNVDSKLGRFYDLAIKIHEKEQDTEFLENYGIDILRLYAPVDGSELGCSPKIWYKDNIREDLIDALEANTPAIKIKGDYYIEADKYFVQDTGEIIEEQVNFMYLREWPTKMDVWPSEDNVLRAEPVGLEEGLGILGFCYVPYHFVYDLGYPVLIQIYDGEEIFQFATAVVIDKNVAKQAPDIEGLPDVAPELCEHKLTKMNIYTYNTQLDPVEASIKYKCFDTTCYIGETEQGSFSGNFPQCINGYVLASAPGYKTAKYIKSTVESGEVTVILDKKYSLDLEVRKDGTLREEYAIVTFSGDDVITAVYPEQKNIELTEGNYEVMVYVYTNSTIELEGTTREECVDVPKSGIAGLFGSSDEKCFTLEIPDQIISFAVSGGGTQNYYVTESELESGSLTIEAADFGKPAKVQDLQENYNKIQTESLNIYFG
jgi:hypothetical protein